MIKFVIFKIICLIIPCVTINNRQIKNWQIIPNPIEETVLRVMGREVVSIHVGQCGIQVGNACWELFCLEHGIGLDGTVESNHDVDAGFNTFFNETATGKYVPRCCFIDSEPMVIDQVRTGNFRKLYRPSQLISGREDTANLYTRGFYSNRNLLAHFCDSLHHLLEECSSLQGFLVFHSLGGGTGSGFGGRLLQQLSNEYPKSNIIDFGVIPSPKLSTSTVEPYNACHSLHFIRTHADVACIFDNEALYSICDRSLQIEASYTNINRLIAQVVSSMTSSQRFAGALNVSLNEFKTNLVPYPTIQFALCSYAPIVSVEKSFHNKLTVEEITNSVFEPQNIMAKCDPRHGKYMACCLMYRGDVVPREVSSALKNIKSKNYIQFVDWCPTGFKCGINDQPPTHIPGGDLAKVNKSVCMISNTTAISEVFEELYRKTKLLYSHRAFVHWFTADGIDEAEMPEYQSYLADMQTDYEEVAFDTPMDQFNPVLDKLTNYRPNGY